MPNKLLLATGTLLCLLLVLFLLQWNGHVQMIPSTSVEAKSQPSTVADSPYTSKLIADGNPIPSKEVMDTTMTDSEIELLYNRYIMAPRTTCSMVERMGNINDGGWEMCLDPRYAPDPKDCLVYSFGINNDFSYDDAMENYGCEVHSFDPSMTRTTDHVRGQKVHFHLEGIGPRDIVSKGKWKLYTMKTFRRRLGHEVGQRRLDVMKMDVEGAEVDSLPVAFKDGSLSDVPQIALEFHSHRGRTRQILNLLREAHDLGLRIYLTNKNLRCKRKSPNTQYMRTLCHETYMVNITLAKQNQGQ